MCHKEIPGNRALYVRQTGKEPSFQVLSAIRIDGCENGAQRDHACEKTSVAGQHDRSGVVQELLDVMQGLAETGRREHPQIDGAKPPTFVGEIRLELINPGRQAIVLSKKPRHGDRQAKQKSSRTASLELLLKQFCSFPTAQRQQRARLEPGDFARDLTELGEV